MKIQNKITLLFFGLGTVGLILLTASIFYFVSEFNFEDFFKRLEARANLAAEIKIHPDDKSAAYQEVRNRYLEKLSAERDFQIKVDSNGNFSQPAGLKLPETFYKSVLQSGKARYNEKNNFYYGGLYHTDWGDYIVVVSAADPYGFKELDALSKILVIVFIVFLVLIFVAGRIFSHYTVKPITSIIKRVNNISANNLNSRLKELKGKDELAELVFTFNNMLNRLETAFETQNNFVSNASHELKTPLAIINGELELLLTQDDLSEQTKTALQVVSSHAEKLSHILTSLLGLAQSGFDGKRQNWQKIRVDELVLNVAEAVKKIDPEGTIQIDFNELPQDESQLLIDGNLNLLQLAFSNIFLNACKYSNHQTVKVSVTSKQGRISVSVVDVGIGIPDEEQQHIFEPFFRASNTTNFDGHGVGLPLTLNIIRLHKGSIGIRSEENVGTEINLMIPVSGF
ncbi:MAG: HAMP domain-containing sensor histidine kinase [Pedobacter sp.]